VSRLPRRRTTRSATLLVLSLILASPVAAQARGNSGGSWLDALTGELVQWVASWQGASAPSAAGHAKTANECGIQIDPNGNCSSH
jgi:hypothetical protein